MRTQSAVLGIAAAALAAALPACSGGNGAPGGGGSGGAGSLPQQAESCFADLGNDFSASRKVDVGAFGAGQDAAFAPYEEGGKVTMIKGNQGLHMITPVVRVTAAPEDGARACLQVRLVNDYQGGIKNDPAATDALQANVLFERSGDSMITAGTLYDAFSFTQAELEGVELKLTATVKGKGFQGDSTVKVVLE
jgi:hypothetical protein